MASIVKDFREYEHVDSPVTIIQPANGKMIVAVSQPELEYSGTFGWMNDGENGWDISRDTLKIAAVKFKVKASTDDQYRVIMKKYSFGRTNEEATARAEKIQYTVISKDSVLDLENGYAIDKQSKFRVQNVEIEIMVPVGKKLRFDESVYRKLNSLDIKVKRSYRRNRISGIEFTNEERSFRYSPGVDYVMGINGELINPNGKTETTEPDNNYRFEKEDSLPKDDVQKENEQLRKQNEEKDRKIKELEKNQQKSTSRSKQKAKINDNAFAIGPSPMSSLVEWF